MLDNEIKYDIEQQISQLTNHIIAIGNKILSDFPVEFYVNDVKSYIEVRNYDYLSPKLMKFFDSILSTYDSYLLTLLHKLALSFLMKESVERLERGFLPTEILYLYQNLLERILRDFSTQSDDFYNHRNDLFLKDLAVCSLRLIPVGGSWLTEVSGIGRRFLVSGGARQFVDASLFALFKARGLKPYYQIHMDIRCLEGFSPRGRDQCYLGIAELLKLNPRIKGMYAVSWFYDPKLEKISPNLLYLRKEPEQNGARFFQIGTSATDIKFATAKSATRRKLYNEGKYLPTSYLLIWPRKELLSWADKRTENQIINSGVEDTAATPRRKPENRA
jgi:hypothetical protein